MKSCENCHHFAYDCHLDGELYYFCELLEKNEKDIKPCVFYNDDEDFEREKLTFENDF